MTKITFIIKWSIITMPIVIIFHIFLTSKNEEYVKISLFAIVFQYFVVTMFACNNSILRSCKDFILSIAYDYFSNSPIYKNIHLKEVPIQYLHEIKFLPPNFKGFGKLNFKLYVPTSNSRPVILNPQTFINPFGTSIIIMPEMPLENDSIGKYKLYHELAHCCSKGKTEWLHDMIQKELLKTSILLNLLLFFSFYWLVVSLFFIGFLVKKCDKYYESLSEENADRLSFALLQTNEKKEILTIFSRLCNNYSKFNQENKNRVKIFNQIMNQKRLNNKFNVNFSLSYIFILFAYLAATIIQVYAITDFKIMYWQYILLTFLASSGSMIMTNSNIDVNSYERAVNIIVQGLSDNTQREKLDEIYNSMVKNRKLLIFSDYGDRKKWG